MKRLAAFYRWGLSLRYRVRLEGVECLEGSATRLFLPNHQATVDPQILFAHLYRYTEASPLVSAGYTSIGVLKPLFRKIDAVPVPDMERGRQGVEQTAGLPRLVAEALAEGKSMLIYPAGHLCSQAEERIRNKQTAWQVCRRLPEGTQIIGVRIRGLWGSMWSRARTGKSPDFLTTYLKGLFYLLANLIFFLPRRPVQITFVDITQEALQAAAGDRQSFNEYLEGFYNAPGADRLHLLSHFFFVPTRVSLRLIEKKQT